MKFLLARTWGAPDNGGMKRVLAGVVGLGVGFLAVPVSRAGDEAAEAIIHKLAEKTTGDNEQVYVSMRVQNPDGSDRDPERQFMIQAAYANQNEGKSLVTFMAPRGVKGTKVLTVRDKSGTGQWVYLPGAKRVARINSEQDAESVLDSDVSFSDLKEESTEEFDYTFASGPTADYSSKLCKEPAYAINAVPKKKNTGFAKRVLSISKANFVVCGVMVYDGKGKLVKNLQVSEFTPLGAKMRPAKLIAASHKSATEVISRTVLSYTGWKGGVHFDPSTFAVSSLDK